MGEWIDKVWYIYTMEYYPTIKRNEILTHPTTEINLENTMVSERNQSQKSTYYMTSIHMKVQNRELYRDRKEILGCLGLGWSGWKGGDWGYRG